MVEVLLRIIYVGAIVLTIAWALQAYIKEKKMGKRLFLFQWKVNQWFVYGIFAGIIASFQFGEWNISESDLTIDRAIVAGFYFLFVVVVFLKGIKREKICEKGVIIYEGIRKWEQIGDYKFIKSPDNNEETIVALKLEKKGKAIKKELKFVGGEKRELNDLLKRYIKR